MALVGQMLVWPVAATPKDWLPCTGGRYYNIEHMQLWATIATIYGEGGGRGTGILPDLVNNRALGAGEGENLPGYELGSSGKDSSSGAGGIHYVDIGAIICAAGSLYDEAPVNLLGMIIPYAGRVLPDGYAFCQGELLSIARYPQLFSVIGTTFGGDGRTTFALPDLRGRTPLGADDTNPLGHAGVNLSEAGVLGYQTINYITPLKAPMIPGGSVDTPFIGEIVYTATSFAPRGWAFCQGQLLPIQGYPELFSLIGTTYGGDGTTTFGLPDLRGAAVIETGPGVDYHGTLSTHGAGQVAYLGVQPVIALQGNYPVAQ